MGRTRIGLAWATAALFVAMAGGPVAAEDSVREKALKLNGITGQDALKGKILELIKDKPELKKIVSQAAAMVKEKEQPFNYNGAYIIAQSAIYIKEYETSIAFYKLCQEQARKLKSAQKLAEVYPGLVALLYETKKYEAAVKASQEFLELDTKGSADNVQEAKITVLSTMIRAITRQKKYDEALSLTDKFIERDEGGWYFLRIKAEVLHDASKFDESIAVYEDAIERLGKIEDADLVRDNLIERCRYEMTSVYTDMNEGGKAIEALRKLLKDHPESSTYNNDLGYVLADHDKDLDEAEKLVRKALELDKAERQKLKDQGLLDADDDKENAAYLDSLGWVLFKKKNYVEAKKCLLEAVKSDDGKHVEIFDHLGDVHKALKEKAEAAAIWQKALDLDNVTKRDESRKEAIKKKIADDAGANP